MILGKRRCIEMSGHGSDIYLLEPDFTLNHINSFMSECISSDADQHRIFSWFFFIVFHIYMMSASMISPTIFFDPTVFDISRILYPLSYFVKWKKIQIRFRDKFQFNFEIMVYFRADIFEAKFFIVEPLKMGDIIIIFLAVYFSVSGYRKKAFRKMCMHSIRFKRLKTHRLCWRRRKKFFPSKINMRHQNKSQCPET